MAQFRRSFEEVQPYAPRTSLDDASVTELPTIRTTEGLTTSSTMIIEMVGKDEPGRLARISKLLSEQGLAIADMVRDACASGCE